MKDNRQILIDGGFTTEDFVAAEAGDEAAKQKARDIIAKGKKENAPSTPPTNSPSNTSSTSSEGEGGSSDELARVKEDLRQSRKEVSRLQSELSEANAALKAENDSVNEIKRERDDFRQNFEAARNQLEELESEAIRLQAEADQETARHDERERSDADQGVERSRSSLIPWIITAVATISLVVALGIWWYNSSSQTQQNTDTSQEVEFDKAEYLRQHGLEEFNK